MEAVSRSRRAFFVKTGAAVATTALGGAPFVRRARAADAQKLVYQTGWLPHDYLTNASRGADENLDDEEM